MGWPGPAVRSSTGPFSVLRLPPPFRFPHVPLPTTGSRSGTCRPAQFLSMTVPKQAVSGFLTVLPRERAERARGLRASTQLAAGSVPWMLRRSCGPARLRGPDRYSFPHLPPRVSPGRSRVSAGLSYLVVVGGVVSQHYGAGMRRPPRRDVALHRHAALGGGGLPVGRGVPAQPPPPVGQIQGWADPGLGRWGLPPLGSLRRATFPWVRGSHLVIRLPGPFQGRRYLR